MEFISPHRYIKNTSKMEKFSQSTCWILAEDFKHIKGNEWVPYNQAGWKAEGKRKRRGGRMRSLLLEGSWKWERIFTSGEVPSPVRGSAETEGVFQGLGKEQGTWPGADRVRSAQMVRATTQHAPAWDGRLRVHTGSGCWDLQFGEPAQEADWEAAQLQGEYIKLGPTTVTENMGTPRRQG